MLGLHLPSAAVNVALSDDLYIITNGSHVSRRTISSIFVLIVYIRSCSYIYELYFNKQTLSTEQVPETCLSATSSGTFFKLFLILRSSSLFISNLHQRRTLEVSYLLLFARNTNLFHLTSKVSNVKCLV